MVRMAHPGLPGRVITVTERAARHHERAGWVDLDAPAPPAEAPAPAPDPEPDPAPEPAAPADKTETTRRGRTTKKQEE